MWPHPVATTPSETQLLQHGIVHSHIPFGSGPAPTWPYPCLHPSVCANPWPRSFRCSSTASCTAMDVQGEPAAARTYPTAPDALRCPFSSMDLSLGHNPFGGTAFAGWTCPQPDTSRSTCPGVELSDTSGCPVPTWTHPQVPVPLGEDLLLHRLIPGPSPFDWSSPGVPTCPDSTAQTQQRCHTSLAVIQVLPGTEQ